MTNTQLRIISALVLVGIVTVAIAIGKSTAIAMIGFVGLLVVDEVIVNFLDYKRKNIGYLVSNLTYTLGFIYFNYIDTSWHYLKAFNNAGLLLNFLLLFYLFATKHESKSIYKLLRNYSVFLGIVILIPVFNLSGIMMFKNWISLIIGLIVLNFSVDTAAWFWGKNFGKHKLWPAVSPKKTVEGFIGGILSSVIVTVIYWIIFVGNVNYQLVLSFFTIACCSQIGDLVQSKLKRQFEIKDSSNLIPGHGGVYDRVDSLLFVVPLYLWVLTNFLG